MNLTFSTEFPDTSLIAVTFLHDDAKRQPLSFLTLGCRSISEHVLPAGSELRVASQQKGLGTLLDGEGPPSIPSLDPFDPLLAYASLSVC